VEVDGHGPGALSKQGDLPRVPTQGCNVVPDPEQSLPLVPEAEVARSGLLLGAQEAQDAQPVLDSHHHSRHLYCRETTTTPSSIRKWGP